MNNQSVRQILLWAAVILVLLIMWNSYQSSDTSSAPVQQSYSHFITNLPYVTEIYVFSDQRSFSYRLSGQQTLNHSVFPPGETASVMAELKAQKTKIGAEPPTEGSGLGTLLLISFVPVLILIGALVWIAKKSQGGATSFIGSPGKRADREKNTVRLKDVAGNPGDFDEVYELIDFLKQPEKYLKAGAALPHGILLYGPPGCGKTLLARAIAGEAEVPFHTISGSDFVELFVGVGASRVRKLFDDIKKDAPAILFIDEIDAVAGHRSSGTGGQGHREADQTLNQLLVEMDGFEDHDSVLVIGATNRPDALDAALMRPGRFDRIISINLPDVNAREKILQVHTKKRNLDDDIDLRTIAKGTPGFSGADLMNLVNEAAMLVAKGDREIMTMEDLDGARDRIMMGKEKSLAMDDKEKEITAYHEAGHAIVGYNMPDHDPIYKISIVPRGRALGVTMYLPDRDRYSHSHQYLLSQLASLMGGRAAEELQYGKPGITTGAANDLERATRLARNMITRWGFSDTGLISFEDNDYNCLSDDTKTQIDNQVRALLKDAYDRATSILKKNKNNLQKVADALIETETVDFQAFLELIGEKNG